MILKAELLAKFAAVILVASLLFWTTGRENRKKRAKVLLVCVLFGAAVGWICASRVPDITEYYTLTPLQAEIAASGTGRVTLICYEYDGEFAEARYIESERWTRPSEESGALTWGSGPDTSNEEAGTALGIQFPVGWERFFVFETGPEQGAVMVVGGEQSWQIDTCASETGVLRFQLPRTKTSLLVLNSAYKIAAFTAVNTLLSGMAYGVYCILSDKSREGLLRRGKKYSFLFSALVRRDFTKKYKRTILGMAWSVISPLLNLLIMYLVFKNFFGNNVNHYAIYLFCGQLVFAFFTDATNLGMSALVSNAPIFTKVNVPKYLFLFSQNVSALINFALTLLVLFLFTAIDGLPFTWKFFMLLYPIACMIVFNLGLGMILSALYVFFRDMQYLWGILTQLIMWLSAIFYTLDSYSYTLQNMFLLNPIYIYIRYFRKIIIDGVIPTPAFHILAACYALAALAVGMLMYKKYNHEFLYYV